MGAKGRKPAAEAKLLPTTFTALSSIFTDTALTPAFWISSAFCLVMKAPSSSSTSPVMGETTISAEIWFTMRAFRLSFLLNLYRPTRARSYRLSKNRPFKRLRALSSVGGSPGRWRL